MFGVSYFNKFLKKQVPQKLLNSTEPMRAILSVHRKLTIVVIIHKKEIGNSCQNNTDMLNSSLSKGNDFALRIKPEPIGVKKAND